MRLLTAYDVLLCNMAMNRQIRHLDVRFFLEGSTHNSYHKLSPTSLEIKIS